MNCSRKLFSPIPGTDCTIHTSPPQSGIMICFFRQTALSFWTECSDILSMNLLLGLSFMRFLKNLLMRKFCAEARDCIGRYVYSALQGGSMMRGWTNDEKEMVTCCNDGACPVIFKLERIDG